MCEIDREAIPQMCWSNLQPELVQQASPLKGLMQCQNLWLRGHPLFLPPQSDKSWISFPHYSFLFFLLLNSSAREAWDVRCEWNIFIRREENPRSETRPEPIRANDIPTVSFFFSIFFFLSFLLLPAVTLCGVWQADWNQHCVRAIISQKDIKHAETSISNRPLTAFRHRRRRGEMRGRLGLWGDAVQYKCLLQASLRAREDKIKSIRLSPSSSCFLDSKATGTLNVRRSVHVCASAIFPRACVAAAAGGSRKHTDTQFEFYIL